MSQRYREFHYDIGEYIQNCGNVESGPVQNGCPHGHVFEVFGVSHPYLRCKTSLKFDLLREKLYFFKESTLSRVDALFCDARFFFSFFLISSSK